MTFTPEPISILGLGNMGSALASVFLANGYPVTVWNRTIEKAQPLVPKGARMAKSPADCVQAGTVVLISLASDVVVRDVINGIPTFLDRSVMNFTTSRPQWEIGTADIVTNKLQASGYLHGWINSIPSDVKDQQATVTYSGPNYIFAKQVHVCKVLGKALWLSDDHRKICILENAALSMVAGLIAGISQSLALAGAAGVNTMDFTHEVLLPLLPLLQYMLPQMAKKDRDQSHLMPDDLLSIGTMLQLVSDARETAETTGVSSHLFEGFHTLLRQGAELGNGAQDVSTLIRVLRGDGHQR